MPTNKKPHRTPVVVVLGFNAALLMAPVSALASITTYVPAAEAGALAVAAGLGLGALILLALTWRRLPRPVRVLGVPVALMAVFALWTIGDRCIW
ncbi:MAG: hypothetical protein KAI24_12305 [Planctomycetes bacterium]|nr:hypothetical protein [Planctomycetota bacterium]